MTAALRAIARRRHAGQREDLGAVDLTLEQLRAKYPGRSRMIAAVEQLLAQPEGRTPALGLHARYKYLSWDAHAVIASLRDVQAIEHVDGPELRFSHGFAAEEAASIAAGTAVNLLAFAWHTLEQDFAVFG